MDPNYDGMRVSPCDLDDPQCDDIIPGLKHCVWERHSKRTAKEGLTTAPPPQHTDTLCLRSKSSSLIIISILQACGSA